MLSNTRYMLHSMVLVPLLAAPLLILALLPPLLLRPWLKSANTPRIPLPMALPPRPRRPSSSPILPCRHRSIRP
ncbi:hypothetical protein BKA81DRAFT_352064 [Phyllosticta paracitricarpa]